MVLITIDLPNAADEQRTAFNKVLARNCWIKINTLTTSWEASFEDQVERKRVINAIKCDLQEAKDESKVEKVEYAIQMDKVDVIVSSL